ncbi:MAG: hypothetical protein V1897_06520 [Pseudomonadota bacterium]
MLQKFSLTKYLGIWYLAPFALMAVSLVMMVNWQMKKQALDNTDAGQIEQLKEINPEIRAVFASGYSGEDLKNDMERLGVYGFIPKPFNARSFLQVVNEVFEKNKL